MKKRSTNKLYILGIAVLMLMGCSDDFFTEKAGDRITPEQHYKTFVDAMVSMQGAIMPLQDIMPRQILVDGLRSDLMDVTANADAYLRQINEHIYSPDNPYTNPADFYKVIININEVLANIHKVYERDREFDDFFLKYSTGALIGMRSWTYLTLARIYGKVAYIDDNLTTLPSDLTRNVMTKAVLIDTLINQITPYIHTDLQLAEWRVENYMNTKALLGELYLEKNDYANAVTYLKMACESYGNSNTMLKVEAAYQNFGWSNIFLNAQTQYNENLSVIPFSLTDDQYNLLATWLGYNRDFVVQPTRTLVDSFLAQKPLAGNPGDLYRGKSYTFNIDTLGQINDSTFITQPYITKYEIDKNEPASSDIILSRAADLHLMLAEALNRLGDANSQKYALILMNQGWKQEASRPAAYTRWSANLGIRGRVYLTPRVVDLNMPVFESQRIVEDLIMAERAMELAYEGKRWFDLVRVAERRGDPAYLADKVAEKFKGTPMYDVVRNRLMDPANWYLPFE